jgi:hypothetical protein
MTKSNLPTYLLRYTDLPALLYLLSSRAITLLDPTSWEDANDTYFMSQYKERKNLKKLLTLCFSQVPVTYHHWCVFSNGPSGVCIEFNRVALGGVLNNKVGVLGKLCISHLNCLAKR